jgi:hypothetical protein
MKRDYGERRRDSPICAEGFEPEGTHFIFPTIQVAQLTDFFSGSVKQGQPVLEHGTHGLGNFMAFRVP